MTGVQSHRKRVALVSIGSAMMQKLYAVVRSADGRTPADPAWAEILFVVGLAWQKFEIEDDDVRALEEMLRVLRFPRR